MSAPKPLAPIVEVRHAPFAAGAQYANDPRAFHQLLNLLDMLADVVEDEDALARVGRPPESTGAHSATTIAR